MTLDHPIRALIVEDVAADADLMIRHLRRSGLQVEVRVVQEEEAFREALRDFRPDVVLADSRLPRFSGRRALRIARSADPFLPVIMVTGTLPEDRIIRLTAMGLTNYVFKERLLRLTPAVVHALSQAEERRQAVRDRAALEASELRFRSVVHASGDAMMVVDDGGVVSAWNPAAERMFGHPTSEIVGRSAAVLIPMAWRTHHKALWQEYRDPAVPFRPLTREMSAVRADGSEFPVETTVSSWVEAGRRYFSAQVRDITRRKAEARGRSILSRAVDQTSTSVVITDLKGAIEYVNPAFERLTGYTLEEVRGQTPRVLQSGRQDPEVYDRLWAAILAGRVFQGEFINRRKDGSEYHQRTTIFPALAEDGTPEQFVGLGQDVTQERVLERQLRQAQKMQAVGQLAGGIAHDFNNILTAVMTNAHLLEQDLGEDGTGDVLEYAKDIAGAAERGRDLVRRLMAVTRNDAAVTTRTDVRQVVDEAMRTVRRILPADIEIEVSHPDATLPALVDESALHQALLNVASNARDAMEGGGRLQVRTALGRMTDAQGSSSPCVAITVTDTGVGMDEATRARIFEPFFTTKEVGRGTGLGLSMVYGSVTHMGGQVEVASSPGRGTSLTILLPRAHQGAPRPTAETHPPRHPARAPVASGTILVAEDQDDIRRLSVRVLRRMGFQVLTAARGDEAMALLREGRGAIDMVLADLVMPGGGGAHLYRETLEWPDQPRFLLMSGYAAAELNGNGDILGQVPFLPKPFSLESLQTAVTDAMART